MAIIELKDGSMEYVETKEDFVNKVVKEYLGESSASYLEECFFDIEESTYSYEEYSELEAKKYELEEEVERLEEKLEAYENGENPLSDQLKEIQQRLIWIIQDVRYLEKLSKAKKVTEQKENILKSLKNLYKLTEEIM